MAKQKKEAEPAEAAKPKKTPAKKKPRAPLKKPNRPKEINPIGRPKIPEETRNAVLQFLREGNSKRDACLGAGMSIATLCDWQAKAADFREKGIVNEYTKFIEQVEQAQAEARRFALQCWKSHMPTDWRAAMSYLERTDPEHYRLNQKMDVNQTMEVTQKAILEIPDNGRRTI